MRSLAVIVTCLAAACSSPKDDAPRALTLSLDPMSIGSLQAVARETVQPTVPAVDMSYHTSYSTEGPTANLTVWPREGGAPVTFAGPRIEAEFFHAGHVLVVKVRKGDTNEWDYHHFFEPIRWDSK